MLVVYSTLQVDWLAIEHSSEEFLVRNFPIFWQRVQVLVDPDGILVTKTRFEDGSRLDQSWVKQFDVLADQCPIGATYHCSEH